MKGLYMKLAAVGVRKNGKSYVPYILTAAVMASILYIMAFLANNSLMDTMNGGYVMKTLLTVGTVIMSVFSLIFLFYTNSFLIKRRKKEFGLYNILGLKKSQIACVLIWEALLVYGISVISGLALGILFSKLAEQLATKMLLGDISYTFTVDGAAVIITLAVFAVIFFLILLNSLRQLFFSRPIELLRSGNTGEKPPKANIPFAVLGLIMLIAAYYMAISIKDPSKATVTYTAAMIMIIVATYMLFVTGSVALCAVLKKNRRYYYKTEHFVSVSQMSYRMRKNGAGLASICILSMLVLVIISATASLYFGVWDYVNREYPSDIEVMEFIHTEEGAQKADFIENTVLEVCREKGVTPKNLRYEYVVYPGRNISDGFGSTLYVADVFPEDPVRELSLADGEIAYYEPFSDYMSGRETITFGESVKFTLKRIDKDLEEANNHRTYYSSWETPDSVVLLFINNRESLFKLCEDLEKENLHMSVWFKFGFDVPEGMADDEIIELRNAISLAVSPERPWSNMAQSKPEFAGEIFGTFGGLFFLGVLLGSVFLLAAILTMYYKQITEGLEDAERFEILHKVGMSRREIKKTISSQVLTVFFLPLIAAGVHLAVAFAILSKLFLLWEMRPVGTGQFALVTLGCYLIFSVVYIIVYKLTSGSYSRIVNK